MKWFEWLIEQVGNVIFKDILKKLSAPVTDLLRRYTEPINGIFQRFVKPIIEVTAKNSIRPIVDYFREHLDLTLLLGFDHLSGSIARRDYESAIFVVLVLYVILVQPEAKRTVKPMTTTFPSNLKSGNEHHSAGGRSGSQQQSVQTNNTADLEQVSSVPRSRQNIYSDVPSLASNGNPESHSKSTAGSLSSSLLRPVSSLMQANGERGTTVGKRNERRLTLNDDLLFDDDATTMEQRNVESARWTLNEDCSSPHQVVDGTNQTSGFGHAMRDILILHSAEDKVKAYEYEKHVKDELQRELNMKLHVDVLDEIGIGKGHLSALDNIFETYRYIFVLMTEHSIGDALFGRQTEMGLIDSLDVSKNHYRVIPLWWTKQTRTERSRYPASIRAILGIEYADFVNPIFKATYIKNVKDIIFSRRKFH